MTRFEWSAGIIVFRVEEGRPLYLMLKHPSYWGFAKGHLEDGETEEDTARRELAEETGIEDVEMVPGFRKTIEYWFKQGEDTVHKRVVFFLARAKSPFFRLSEEHEAAAWMEFPEAHKKARYKNQRDLLSEAHQKVMESLGLQEPGPDGG